MQKIYHLYRFYIKNSIKFNYSQQNHLIEALHKFIVKKYINIHKIQLSKIIVHHIGKICNVKNN